MHVKRSLSSIRKWGWQAGSVAHCAFAQGDGKSLTLVCPHAQPVARLGKVFWTLAQPGENYMVSYPKKKTKKKTSAKRCMQIAKNYNWPMGRIRLVNYQLLIGVYEQWVSANGIECNKFAMMVPSMAICATAALTWFLKLQWSQLLVKCSARN